MSNETGKNTLFWVEDFHKEYEDKEHFFFTNSARTSEEKFNAIKSGTLNRGYIDTSLTKADIITILIAKQDFKKVFRFTKELRRK